MLLDLVELCGNIKINEAYPDLKKIFLKRSLFSKKKTDNIRLAAGKSLLQFNQVDARKLIQEKVEHSNKHLKLMLKQLLDTEFQSEAMNEDHSNNER